MGNKQGGYASPIFLIVIMFLSVLIGGISSARYALTKTINTWADKTEYSIQTKTMVLNYLEEWKEYYPADEIGPASPFWSQLPQSLTHPDGTIYDVITHEELSSKINPNFIRFDFYENTQLTSYLVPGKNGKDLQEYITENGFTLDLESFSNFLTPEAIKKMTAYSYINVNNVSDPEAINQVVSLRTGNKSIGKSYFDRINARAINKDPMLTDKTLQNFMGNEYEQLYPLINAYPLWNVNYMSDELINALYSHSSYKTVLQNGQLKATAIIANRKVKVLNQQDLQRITAVDTKSRFYQYIGTLSYFWKIIFTQQSSNEEVYAIISMNPVTTVGSITWEPVLRTWGTN